MEKEQKYHAIKVDEEKCFGCTHCMKACPTEAIRVVDGLAEINTRRCVDCGNCLRVCPADAFYVEQDDLELLKGFKYRILLFPSVFIGQFSETFSEDQIYSALLQLGFTHAYEVEQPIGWLSEAIEECAVDNVERPLISSFCPAVVRLIQCKYPSLAENIVNRKAPHDLAAHFALGQLEKEGAKPGETGIFYVTPCSAKMAAVNQPVAEKKSVVNGIINMKDLFNRVMKIITGVEEKDTAHFRRNLSSEGILWSLPRGEVSIFKSKTMAIDGIHNVVKFLERLENDEVPELHFLEMKSCNQGCAGGILLSGNRFLTVERLQKRAARYPDFSFLKIDESQKKKVKEKLVSQKVKPDYAFSLDENRAKALEKMKKADKILCQLPGIDCGACGAPNCHALAEDVVQGQAKLSDCVFLQNKYLKQQKMNPEKAWRRLENIWGNKRFDADCNKKGGRNEGF